MDVVHRQTGCYRPAAKGQSIVNSKLIRCVITDRGAENVNISFNHAESVYMKKINKKKSFFRYYEVIKYKVERDQIYH